MVNVIIYGTDSGESWQNIFKSYFVRQYICHSRKKLQTAQIVYKDSVFYVLDMKGNNNTFTKHTCQNCVLISVGNGEGRTQ